jgi:outer membrane protein OmpA-like peptidoglycan-associated protein
MSTSEPRLDAPVELPLLGERWPLVVPLSLATLGVLTALATGVRLAEPPGARPAPSASATVGPTAAVPTQPAPPPSAGATAVVAPPAVAPAPPSTVAPADCAPIFQVRFAPARAEADLDPAAARRLAEWLQARPTARLIVDGHADVHGSVASNLALSHRRAQAVVAALVAAGAPRAHLTARGFGAYAPVPGAPAADQANRRVDFELEGLPGVAVCPPTADAPSAPSAP